MQSINYFGVWDYVVVAGTLLLSLFIGVYYAVVSKQTNEELLLGGRQMNVFAISASMLVTYLSAITILGYPAEIYANGIQIFIMTLLSLIFVPVSTFMFISVFYKMKLTSVYEYLERRYDTVAVRWLASLCFILKSSVMTGVILYAPSIALEKIVGLPVWISIVGIGICGTLYTSIGGLKAVVWTDVFQFVMIIFGMLSIVIKGFHSSGGFIQAFRLAGEHGRLNLFDFTIDPFMRYNTLNFFLGNGFSIICMYGTYQSQVQRYCSLPTFSHAVKAVALSVALKIFTMSLVVFTGVSIFATYAGCDPVRLGLIKKHDQIVPHFVVAELAFIPGIMGLFVSCIFSAVLSSVSSTLNSLSAVTWEDFLSHIPALKKMTPKTQANITRSIAFLYGIICIGMAFLAQKMGSIFQAAMTAVGAFSGPLGAIFIMGLFIPCVNKWGACCGMITGLTIMMYISMNAFLMEKPYHAPLPTSIDQCPAGTNLTMAIDPFNVTSVAEPEWPTKLYTLSYVLYPFVGGLITTIVGVVVGVLTGGCSQAKKMDRSQLHPALLRCSCCCPLEKVTNPLSTHQRADRLSGLYALNSSIGSQDPFQGCKYERVLAAEPGGELKKL